MCLFILVSFCGRMRVCVFVCVYVYVQDFVREMISQGTSLAFFYVLCVCVVFMLSV